jgi:TPR repeat protein
MREESYFDIDLAFSGLNKALGKGVFRACNELAAICRIKGSPYYDKKKAIDYIIQGAEAGDPICQTKLGNHYHADGRMLSKAVYWYMKAAQQEEAVSLYELSEIFRVAAEYTKGEESENFSKSAVEYLCRSAKRNYPDALYSLGERVYYGRDIKKDCELAFNLFEMAAGEDIPEAFYMLGMCYLEGCGVSQDFEKAISYFSEAADMDCGLGAFMLGECYSLGNGVEKNLKTAFKWYKKAEKMGAEEAYLPLSNCYMEGEGVRKSKKTGSFYLNMAALTDGENAKFSYINYLIIKGEIAEAYYWLLNFVSLREEVDTELSEIFEKLKILLSPEQINEKQKRFNRNAAAAKRQRAKFINAVKKGMEQ